MSNAKTSTAKAPTKKKPKLVTVPVTVARGQEGGWLFWDIRVAEESTLIYRQWACEWCGMLIKGPTEAESPGLDHDCVLSGALRTLAEYGIEATEVRP